MRILLSSLLFLLVGCASYPSKNGFTPLPAAKENTSKKTNPYFSDNTKDYIYKAQIEAFGNTFSGILAVKKLGEAHHRLAFTTEMGNTVFDFTFRGDSFKVNRIIKKLDRKIVIGILKRDFFALIVENPEIEETYGKEGKTLKKGSILGKNHYYLFDNEKLSQIARTGNNREKVIVSFSEIHGDSPARIRIVHKNIKLIINLNSL